MLLSPEGRSTSRLPSIYIKTQEHVVPEDIYGVLNETASRVGRFFGGAVCLQPETVHEIHIADISPFDGRFIKYEIPGWWFSDLRRISLFPSKFTRGGEFDWEPNWRYVLRHEVGHAIHAQLISNFEPVSPNHARHGHEAFAEWIQYIAEEEGNPNRVRQRLHPYILAIDERILFDGVNNKELDPHVFMESDAAILNYMFERYGLNKVMEIISFFYDSVHISNSTLRNATYRLCFAQAEVVEKIRREKGLPRSLYQLVDAYEEKLSKLLERAFIEPTQNDMAKRYIEDFIPFVEGQQGLGIPMTQLFADARAWYEE